jgi:hypothetical protein
MSDEGVRACSLAARGLWFDLLCIAGSNKDKEYGFVMVGGRAPSVDQIARRVGATVEEVEILVRELEDARVFSRDRRGIIYCRRMVRAEKSRGNGRLGGNPNLMRQKENPGQVNSEPKAPIPEPEPEPEPEPPRKVPIPPESAELPLGDVPTVQSTAMTEQEPLDARTNLFRNGLGILKRITGKTESSLRPMLGRWLKTANDDSVWLMRKIEDAERERMAEPVSWIEACLRNQFGGRRNADRGGWGQLGDVIKRMESFDDDADGSQRFPALPAPGRAGD